MYVEFNLAASGSQTPRAQGLIFLLLTLLECCCSGCALYEIPWPAPSFCNQLELEKFLETRWFHFPLQ